MKRRQWTPPDTWPSVYEPYPAVALTVHEGRLWAATGGGSLFASADGEQWTAERAYPPLEGFRALDSIDGALWARTYPGYVRLNQDGRWVSAIRPEMVSNDPQPTLVQNRAALALATARGRSVVATMALGALDSPVELWTRAEGEEWQHRMELPARLWALAVTGEQFTLLVEERSPNDSAHPVLYRSMDGLVWERSQFPSLQVRAEAMQDFQGSLYYIYGGLLYRHGTPSPLPGLPFTGARLRHLHTEGSTWVAVGTGGHVAHSPDGVNWRQVLPFTDHSLHWVGWCHGQFYAIGSPPSREGSGLWDSSYWASPDGLHWAPAPSMPSEEPPPFFIRRKESYGYCEISRDGRQWLRIRLHPDERGEQILSDGAGAVLFVSDVMGYGWRLLHLDERLKIRAVVPFGGEQEHVFAIGTDQNGRRLVGVVGYGGGISVWAPDEE